jgi:trehalose/maltose transport system substrate-binding protein
MWDAKWFKTFYGPLLSQFETETGVELELLRLGGSSEESLAELQRLLASRSGEVDIYSIDVVWPGILAEHALDLNGQVPASELKQYLPAILEEYTVDGKLVALPEFVDAGLLYYRADLLEKYGYEAPPATWDELEEMAATIQAGERAAGSDDFWGYVWQGANYEGLTCNALEWQVSHGGGHIIEPDGTITVNNPNTVAAFERAAGWVGTISPPEVTGYDETASHNQFWNGNAALLREWPMFWDDDVHNNLVEGRYGIAVLPTNSGQHAATLGGWGYMVSKYSDQPELATRLVQLLAGPKAWNVRAMDGDLVPAAALYQDPDLLAKRPYIVDLLPVVKSAVARPTTVTGEQYAEVSAAYHNHVHDILTGEVSAAEGVANLEAELVDITGFGAKMP